MRIRFGNILAVIAVIVFQNLPARSGDLLPFALPWDDGTPSLTDVSCYLDKPAGKNGFIHISGEHFVDGAGKRFRIIGVNLAFSADFPTHNQAEKVAARMAKFGINCVRFHHMDTLRSPDGIWCADTKEKQILDAERLDRLDYFIHQLKQQGIYTDLNLKVGRKVVEADGFPEANRLPTYDKGVDYYEPRLIELQKNYARDLLTHKNPYTNTRYVEEPAIAIIEINNESGLVNQWNGGNLDDIPTRYLEPLKKVWNEFLLGKYGSTQSLVAAWSPKVGGSGKDLLTRGLKGWVFQQVELGKGTQAINQEGPDGESALKITTTAVGQESWHVQTYYPGLAVEKGGYYRAILWMRADRSRDVQIGIKMDHNPWLTLDQYAAVNVGTEWKKYEFAFSPSSADTRARLDITDLGDELGTLWVARTSLIDSSPELLKAGEQLENRSVSWILRKEFGGKPSVVKRDAIEFLVHQETEYYRDMKSYIRNELKAQSLIAGTQLGFGVLPSQMVNDFIDHHGYWQHPVFPNRAWDAVDWYIRNTSIVNAEGNVLERLMLARAAGKPYTVSEYNHPAPNTYASETMPLLGAYSAFQDWDGFFLFAYSHSNRYENKSINNFFDIAGHTPKMLALPAVANMVYRGDIAPAHQSVVVSVTPERFLDFLTDRGGSTWSIDSSQFGVPTVAPYLHRIGMRYGDQNESAENPAIPKARTALEADTGELVWNNEIKDKSYVLLRSSKTKGLVGFVAGRSFDLAHGVQLELGMLLQDWVNLLLTFMKTDAEGEHWLLTATGYCENQGMKWKSDAKESVGRDWGSGPPLVEAIPLRLIYTETQSPAHVYPLDERGNRTQELTNSISNNNGKTMIDLMKSQPSLWYEIVMKKTGVKNSGEF